MSSPAVLPLANIKSPVAFGKGDFNAFGQIGSDNLFSPRKSGAPDTIKIGTADVPVKDMDVAEFSPEWWFMYLWKEASSFAGGAEQSDVVKLLAFFNKAFIRPPKFMLDNKYVIPRGPFTGTNALFDTNDLREYLTTILKIGFDWSAVNLSGDKEASSKGMETYINIIGRGQTIHYRLVWRGESWRSYEQLRAKGYETQANDEHRSKQIGADKPWHPFFEPEIKRKLWYRRGQNDNCLYSAVSVAMDWRASVCFPKIEQTSSLTKIQGEVKSGKSLAELHASNKGHIGKVTFSNGKSEYRLVTTSKVALMVLDNTYFDTSRRQVDESLGGVSGKSYPEIAVPSVAGTNILAMVEYARVHHGVEDKDGFTALTRKAQSQMVGRKDLLAMFVDAKAATNYYAIVEKAFTDASKYIPRGYKWTTNGFLEIEPMKGIAEVELNGQRLWRWA